MCVIRKLILCVAAGMLAVISTHLSVAAEVNFAPVTIEGTDTIISGGVTGAVDNVIHVLIAKDQGQSDDFWQPTTPDAVIQNTQQVVEAGIYYVGTVDVEADRTFELRVNLAQLNAPTSQAYRVIARLQSMNQPCTAKFYLPGESDEEMAVEQIANAADVDEIKQLLTSPEPGAIPCADVLGLDMNGYFSMLSNENANKVYQALLNASFSDSQGLKTVFEQAVAENIQEQIQFGHPNYDFTDNIGVLDVSMIIENIGKDYKLYPECDYNLDKKIDIQDADAVMQFILDGNMTNQPTGTPNVKLQMNNLNLDSGALGTVTLSLDKPQAITALQFDITYNPAVFELVDNITINNVFNNYKKGYQTLTAADGNTRIRFLLVASDPLAPATVTQILTFRASSFYSVTSGNYNINVNSVQLHQSLTDLSPAPVECVPSVVTIYKAQKTVLSGGGSSSSSSSSGGGFSAQPADTTVQTEQTEQSEQTNATAAPTQVSSKFTDLAEVNWAVDAISYLTEKKIVNGVDDTRFEPNRSITRAEFIKLLLESFALTDDTDSAEFADVNQNDWFYKYAATAQRLGISKGDGNGAFKPNEPITREDIAVLCRRTAEIAGRELANVNQQVEFIDEQQFSEYAKEDIYILQRAGIINGKGENMFAPMDNASRAEACVMIYRLLGEGAVTP